MSESKYERPKSTVMVASDDTGVTGITVKCGGVEVRASNHIRTVAENMAVQCAMLMAECHRLKWIIKEADRRIGGTAIFDITEMTQEDYQVITVK